MMSVSRDGKLFETDILKRSSSVTHPEFTQVKKELERLLLSQKHEAPIWQSKVVSTLERHCVYRNMSAALRFLAEFVQGSIPRIEASFPTQ
jgi:hypothetical protein